MLTESRNPRTANLDALNTLAVLQRINEEDATVPGAVRRALPQLAQAAEAAVAALSGGGRLFYVGAGTSGRLAVLDAVELVPTYGVPPDLVVPLLAGGSAAMTRSIEGVEDRADLGRADLMAAGIRAGDVVVGVAASGSTPYVLGAMSAARDAGAVTVGLSCNKPAPLLDAANIAVPLLVGPEVVTGSTRMKAGTAQKLALNMMSTAIMVRLGKVYGNLMVDVQTTNDKLRRRARRIVADIVGVDEPAAEVLLAQAEGDLKAAAVMGRAGVSLEEARRRLERAGGKLRSALEC